MDPSHKPTPEAQAARPPDAGSVRCPRCGKRVPEHPGYLSWCECGWNLEPTETRPPRTLLERLYVELGARRGAATFERLARAPDLRARWTPARVLTYAFAALVQLGTLLVAVLAVRLLAFRTLLHVLLGAALLGAAWLARPRFHKVELGKIAPEADFPLLYGLTRRVAQEVGAPAPQAIVLTTQFNAGVLRTGAGQRPVLFLGVPLFSVLEPQEKLALLGHELGHFANGDTTRGVLVGMTMRSLDTWRRVLYSENEFRASRSRKLYMAESASRMLFWVLALVPSAGIWALAHLAWDDQQRAEYLADALGARLAGTAAFVGMLEKLGLRHSFDIAVQKATLRPDSPGAVQELAARIRVMPERERERLRRVSELRESRLDLTHPSTARRIELRRHHEVTEPVDAKEHAALVRELAPAIQTVDRELRDRYRRSLYR